MIWRPGLLWLLATSSRWRASSNKIDHCTWVWLCLWTAEMTWNTSTHTGNTVICCRFLHCSFYTYSAMQNKNMFSTFLWRWTRPLLVEGTVCSPLDLSTFLPISSRYSVGHWNGRRWKNDCPTETTINLRSSHNRKLILPFEFDETSKKGHVFLTFVKIVSTHFRRLWLCLTDPWTRATSW